jgi:hypothetical protein
MKPQQAWQAALGQLQLEMPKAAFDTWVRDTEFVNFDENTGRLSLGTRNEFTRDWLTGRMTSTIRKLMAGILNQNIDVRFVLLDDALPAPSSASISLDDIQIPIPKVQSDDPAMAWEIILNTLQGTLPKAYFDTWVSSAQFGALHENGDFVIEVLHPYALEWLQQHLGGKLDDALSAVLNQPVAVRFVAASPALDSQASDPASETVIDFDVIYQSIQDAIVKPGTAVRVPGYLRRWLPYWGLSLGWVYVGLTQLAFFSRANPGTPFRATLRNIALWSGLGVQTVLRQLNSHAAKWFVNRIGESQYSLLAFLPFTPGDRQRLESVLTDLGVQDDPVQALQQALSIRRRDLLPYPAPLPTAKHLEMAPNPQSPVETLLEICRPYKAAEAAQVERLAEELAAHLMPLPDEIHIPHYFIRHHLRQLGSGPGWLVTLLRDEGFISKKDGYQNPLHIPGGDATLAEMLGYVVDRGRKNCISEWLSFSSRRGKPYLANFVERAGQYQYRFQPQELEYLTAEDENNCTLIGEFCQALAEHHAEALLPSLLKNSPQDVLGELEQQDGLAAQMRQSAAQMRQVMPIRGADETERGADGTKRGADETRRGADETLLTLLKHLKTTIKHYGFTTAQLEQFLAICIPSPKNGFVFKGGGALFSWGVDALLRNSEIKSRKARNHIRQHITAHEFVAATLYAVSRADGSVSGLLTHVLTNPEGVQLDPPYQALAALPPAALANLLRNAVDSGGVTDNPDWNAVMSSVEQGRYEDLAQRLALIQTVKQE